MLLLVGGKMLPRLEANHFRAGPEHTVKINGAATHCEPGETAPRKAERVDGLTQRVCREPENCFYAAGWWWGFFFSRRSEAD